MARRPCANAPRWWILALLVAVTATVSHGQPPTGDDNLSATMGAADLVAQVHVYVDELAPDLVDEVKYAAAAEDVKRDSNTLIALALVLSKHDGEHELKAAAPSLLAAARELAAAKDFSAASRAFSAVQAAAGGEAVDAFAEVKWERMASLGQLMNQVTLVNSRIRRNMRRLERNPEGTAGDAVLLAAIAQVAVYDTHEVKDPAQIGQWQAMCREMRDAAGELAGKVKAVDKAGATAALTRLTKSCDDCHAVFHPVPE